MCARHHKFNGIALVQRTGARAGSRQGRVPTCGGHGVVGGNECWRCEGRGAAAMDFPLDTEFPPGIRDGHVARVSLQEFGIANFYLTVLFRVSDGA